MEKRAQYDLETAYDEWIHSMLDEVSAVAGKPVHRLDSEVAHVLELYPWPGGRTELRDILGRAVRTMEGKTLAIDDLPSDFLARVCRSTVFATPAMMMRCF